jgi:hypothetical protein
MQDRGTVCAKVQYAQKSFWAHPMELLGDLGQIEACFGSFGDSANLDARHGHGLRQKCNRLRNYFGHTRWNF